VADFSASRGPSAVSTSHHWLPQLIELHQGSGSTYVYGYCDATYQEGWGRDETVNFVKNSPLSLLPKFCKF
jgi:hypothetical protein